MDRRALLRGGLVTVGGLLLPRCTSTAPLEPNARPTLIDAVAARDGQDAAMKRLFPLRAAHHLDPFVLFDDFGVAPPAGFPTHPHRGFEAVTYMMDGGFHHQDNLGHDSQVFTGGVQVFTSGRGAWHSEMPARAQVNRGLQLWVNLPPGLKKMEPGYAGTQGQEIPETHRRGVTVRTAVGPGSPVQLQTEVKLLDVALQSGAVYEDAVAKGWTAILYVVEGLVRVGDVELTAGRAALPNAGAFTARALSAARVLFVAGVPHRQPIFQHGPYVD